MTENGDRLVPLVISEHGVLGAHARAYLEEQATLAVNKPGGVPAMRGTFAVSKYVAKAKLVRRWTARIVWGMQRHAAARILSTWRASAFLRSFVSREDASPAAAGVELESPPVQAGGLDDLD